MKLWTPWDWKRERRELADLGIALLYVIGGIVALGIGIALFTFAAPLLWALLPVAAVVALVVIAVKLVNR